MNNEAIGRSAIGNRVAAACVLATFVSGCLSEVSTSVRETAGPSVEHFRLVRPGVVPIAAQFHQVGHSIVGQLALTNACNTESVQSIKRQEVTDRHTNRGAAIGWLLAGGVVTALGTGLMVASGGADKRVTCGDYSDGDECHSMSGAMLETGLLAALSGLTVAVPAGISLAQKPKIETKDLGEEQISFVTSSNVPCAPPTNLEGIVVAIDLPGNGNWSGRSAADGTVRIEVQPSIPMPEGESVSIRVQSVPSTLASNVVPGAVLAAVTFVKPQALQETKLKQKQAKR